MRLTRACVSAVPTFRIAAPDCSRGAHGRTSFSYPLPWLCCLWQVLFMEGDAAEHFYVVLKVLMWGGNMVEPMLSSCGRVRCSLRLARRAEPCPYLLVKRSPTGNSPGWHRGWDTGWDTPCTRCPDQSSHRKPYCGSRSSSISFDITHQVVWCRARSLVQMPHKPYACLACLIGSLVLWGWHMYEHYLDLAICT